MKIMVISTPVFQVPLAGYGGSEAIAWFLAKGLAEKGHEVALVAPDGSQCPGTTVIPVGPAGRVHERQAFEVYREALPKHQVVFDHSWAKYAYLDKAAGRLPGTVVAGICHAPCDTMYRTLPPVEKPSFICISHDQAAHFEALFSRPARTCYNGVDVDFYKPVEGLPRTDRFLFLARFSAIKGPDIALEACKRAGAGLDLIGDTTITNEPEYFAHCRSMCDGKQLRMVGPASRGNCVWWFNRAFAMLHPTKHFREPFGLAPVESMLCGTPVIAWKYGAVKETVRHGETGFLVESLDQMIVYINELRGKTEHGMNVMRKNCRDWAMQFSVQNMVDRYEQLAQEAIGTGGW